MSTKRGCGMFGLIGKPRSGKTTVLIDIIKGIKAKGGRVLVVDPDGAEMAWNDKQFKRYNDITMVPDNFKGVAVVMYSSKEAHGTPTFPHIQGKMDMRSNGGKRGPWSGITIVLDDANVYARGVLEDSLEWLCMRKRQYGADLICTAHSWGEMSPMFLRFIDVYGIGITSGSPTERSETLKGEALKLTLKVREDVNEYKRLHPDKYPWVFITKDGHPFTGQL